MIACACVRPAFDSGRVAVVAVLLVPVARPGMPHHQQDGRRRVQRDEPREHGPVELVGEQSVAASGESQRSSSTSLFGVKSAGVSASADRTARTCGRPPPRTDVVQRPPEPRPHPGLLLHLAYAAVASDSPASTFPLGSDQSSYRGRCTSASRTPCARGRHSTAPAARMSPDPSRSFRRGPDAPRECRCINSSWMSVRRHARSVPATASKPSAESIQHRVAGRVMSRTPSAGRWPTCP